MKCQVIRKLEPDHPLVQAHFKQCADCRNSLGADRLAAHLLKEYGANTSLPCPETDAYFYTRLQARIRQNPVLSQWEAAVLALRGWVVAFGALAVVLFVLSLQSLNTQSTVNELSLSQTDVGNDASNNEGVFALADDLEEDEHER